MFLSISVFSSILRHWHEMGEISRQNVIMIKNIAENYLRKYTKCLGMDCAEMVSGSNNFFLWSYVQNETKQQETVVFPCEIVKINF